MGWAEVVGKLPAAKGLSLNSYVMRCFEQCVVADGRPAGRE